MKIKHILMTFILMVSTTLLQAIVYEDGTQIVIGTWSVYDNTPTGASIY